MSSISPAEESLDVPPADGIVAPLRPTGTAFGEGRGGSPTGTPPDPSPAHDLPMLESLRAMAAGLVLLTHVGFDSGASLRDPWGAWLARGDAGVAVFFVLSGFLLMRPWVLAAAGRRGPVRVRAYLWRRAVRLIPGYLTALAGLWLLVPSARRAAGDVWLSAATLTTTVVGRPLLPGFGHTWSLGTEVSFYLALPLLGLAVVGRGRANNGRRWRAPLVLAAIATGALIWRVLLLGDAHSPRGAGYWLPGHLDWFGAGMFLAWIRERGRSRSADLLRAAAAAPGAWLVIAGSTYWAATTPLAGPRGLSLPSTAELVTKHLLYLIFAVALLVPVAFADPDGRLARLLCRRPLVWAGTISYGFFLWHVIVLTAVRERWGIEPFSGHFLPLLVGVTGLSLIAATGSWYLVERPVGRRLRGIVP
ncbi:MAG: acyltransferase [Kineosporiaceae bacterium]